MKQSKQRLILSELKLKRRNKGSVEMKKFNTENLRRAEELARKIEENG